MIRLDLNKFSIVNLRSLHHTSEPSRCSFKMPPSNFFSTWRKDFCKCTKIRSHENITTQKNSDVELERYLALVIHLLQYLEMNSAKWGEVIDSFIKAPTTQSRSLCISLPRDYNLSARSSFVLRYSVKVKHRKKTFLFRDFFRLLVTGSRRISHSKFTFVWQNHRRFLIFMVLAEETTEQNFIDKNEIVHVEDITVFFQEYTLCQVDKILRAHARRNFFSNVMCAYMRMYAY